MATNLPRGIRNNNPGNLIDFGIKWAGMTGHDEGGYCVFATPGAGILAACKNLVSYYRRHGLNTVQTIISRWSATDQKAYIANVSKALVVKPTDPLDMSSPTILTKMMVAIIRQENGQQPYPESMIHGAVVKVLGLPKEDA